MHMRFLAVGLLVVFLLFAAALFSIPWLIGEPVQVVRPDSPVIFSSNDQAVAQFQANAAGDFVLMTRRPAGEAAPQIVLEMRDHDMPAVEPAAEPLGGGLFRADGRLPMPGRWILRIAVEDGGTHDFDFVLAEF